MSFAIPFCTPFTPGPGRGATVRVTGTCVKVSDTMADPSRQRFSINFTGQKEGLTPETPLQFCVNYYKGQIEMNSVVGGRWGKKEKIQRALDIDAPIEIIIHCGEDTYLIEFLGEGHFYQKRSSASVAYLYIEGYFNLKTFDIYISPPEEDAPVVIVPP